MSDIRDFCPLWGEWELDTKLGEGSFGSVWKIRRNRPDGEVEYAAVRYMSVPENESIVKLLINDDSFDDEQAARSYFRDIQQDVEIEINAVCKLHEYANIVSYEDYKVIPKQGSIGFDLFMRMELLTPLPDWIREKRDLSVLDVATLGKDITTAIDVLYGYNMIRQGINPRNIFVNDHGVFILDAYNAARMLRNGAGLLFHEGFQLYMSPEYYLGQAVDFRSDIYSLGLILYRLLNKNRLPFLPLDKGITNEESEQAMARRIQGETMIPPRYADAEMAAIVMKACAYKPDDRYTAPQQMIRDLKRYLAKANK